MIKKFEVIERTLYLLKKEMEQNLPDEATLEEMILEINKILQKFIK